MPSTAAVNSRWFKDRIADKNLSLRRLAKLMELDPSAVSRMFSGKRDWAPRETIQFATLVGVPHEDVLVNLGLRPSGAGKGVVPVVGYIDAAGDVHRGNVDAPRRAPAPPDVPKTCVALRFRTVMSAAESFDGWLVYFDPAISRVPTDAVGKLCIVALANRGGSKLGFLRRGYERGTHTILSPMPGAGLLENVLLERAAPVLWVKTG